MKTLLISYDLAAPEGLRDYERIHNHIKTFTYWAKPLESVWLIRTDKRVSEIRDSLKIYTDANDRILVLDVTGVNWATFNLSKKVTDWMHDNL
jgi:hypothetical protein